MDPLASSVGWVFDFDKNRKFGLLFQSFQNPSTLLVLVISKTEKKLEFFMKDPATLELGFFFPPIFLRTKVIHSKNCPDNCQSLFLSLIFVLQA